MALSLIALNYLLLMILALGLFIAAVFMATKWKKLVREKDNQTRQATGKVLTESAEKNDEEVTEAEKTTNDEPDNDVEIEEEASTTLKDN